MNSNKNKLTQYILNAIAANPTFFTGSCGVVNSDGTVNVKRESGNSVNAIAANITGSGDCAVFKVQGQYYAFSTVVNKVDKEAIAINRRSKPHGEKPIVVGILVDKTVGFDFNTLGYYDDDIIEPAKYKSSVTINSAYSTTAPPNSFANINPIGFFVGELSGNSLRQIALIRDGIPDFPLPDTYGQPYYYNSYYGERTFERDNYYSIGYKGTKLKYLGSIKSQVVEPIGNDISKIDLNVVTFDRGALKVSSETLTFRNQVPLVYETIPNYLIEATTIYNDKTVVYVPNSLININFSYGSSVYTQAVKYQALDGSINYALIAGTAQLAVCGVLIWDIGKIDDLSSKENIAGYLGFDWVSTINGSPLPGKSRVSIAYSYGAIGGIVITISSISNVQENTEVFIPEQFLKGTSGNKINFSDLTFSTETTTHKLIINLPSYFAEKLSGAVGEMPKPLEKKSLIAPYRIPKYETNPYPISIYPPPGILKRETKLILYQKFLSR